MENAKPNMAIEDIVSKIEEFDGLSSAIYDNDDLYKDLTRIDVDFENVEYIDEYSLPGTKDMEAFEVIGEGDRAFPVAWCAGGGDWQMPVVFCIYIGADGVLHGYLPDNGNAYDRKENAPYDSADEGSEDWYYVFDAEKMREEVKRSVFVE